MRRLGPLSVYCVVVWSSTSRHQEFLPFLLSVSFHPFFLPHCFVVCRKWAAAIVHKHKHTWRLTTAKCMIKVLIMTETGGFSYVFHGTARLQSVIWPLTPPCCADCRQDAHRNAPLPNEQLMSWLMRELAQPSSCSQFYLKWNLICWKVMTSFGGFCLQFFLPHIL